MRRPILWMTLLLSPIVLWGATQAPTPEEITSERPTLDSHQLGEQKFLINCSACHQPTGLGLPAIFPPLAGSDFIKNNPREIVVSSILKGITGKIIVNLSLIHISEPTRPY